MDEKNRRDALKKLDEAPRYAEALDNWGRLVHQAFENDERAGRSDAWANVLTGIGTSRDKVTETTFCEDGQLPFSAIEALYHGDDMAARIVDAPVEQMFREGYELRLEGDEGGAADEVEAALEELGVDDALEECAAWGRKDGGCKAMLGINDGQRADKPVAEDRIKSIDFIRPLDRWMLFPIKWYDKPLEPKFGQVEIYSILTPAVASPFGSLFEVGAQIHETRMLHFRGARTSIRRRRSNFGWDDSVLHRVYQVLMSFGLSWAGVTHLLSDASQAVMKIKGLLNAIAGNQKDLMLERAALNDQTRSLGRMLMIDADGEDFLRVPTPFGGIPELVDRTAQRLAAAADMPVTVLMRQAPAGLNATGDSDMRQWYDQVGSMQRRKLQPQLKRLIKLLTLAKQGPTGGEELDVDICFRPLYQMTAPEMADVRLKDAQRVQIYIDKGIATAEECGTSMLGEHGYSSEIVIDLDLRAELMAADQESQLGSGKAQIEAETRQTEAEIAAAGVAAKGAPSDKPAPGKPAKPSGKAKAA